VASNGVAPTGAILQASAQIEGAYGRLPLAFERNIGQTDAGVEFLARGNGYTLFITQGGEAVLSLRGGASEKRPYGQISSVAPANAADDGEQTPTTIAVITMGLVGGNERGQGVASKELPGRINYFLGSDRSTWQSAITTYSRVEYRDVYQDIDLIYYGNQHELEYDFIIYPGANPRTIALEFGGVDRLQVTGAGELVAHVGDQQIIQRAPLIYQEVEGRRRTIGGRYVLVDERVVAFDVESYDSALPLVIDPILVYSTVVGGVRGEAGQGIFVDSSGSAYITGSTDSPDFPTTAGAFDRDQHSSDAFVTMLNPSGTAIVYSTYVGGAASDGASGIAVDSLGNAYIVGTTDSLDFPVTPGAFDETRNAANDVFVTKLNADGTSVVYSTYLGGTSSEIGIDIAVDTLGNAYVTGWTASSDFPTTAGAFDTTRSASNDVFITKVDASGTWLNYSTYLGGSGASGSGQQPSDIAVDPAGNAYVTGTAFGTDFPTTLGSFYPWRTDYYEAFVTKMDSVGSSLVYSTYLGGSEVDIISGIAVDAAGNGYVTGSTYSADFPTTEGAFDISLNGDSDSFVSKFDPNGASLIYSTYLGGTASAHAYAIAVDADGNAYVTGRTDGYDFPKTTGERRKNFSQFDADIFVTKMDASGGSLEYSTYFGGTDQDVAVGIAVDTEGAAYVVGWSGSQDFPITFASGPDGFGVVIAKVTGPDLIAVTTSDPPPSIAPGRSFGVSDEILNRGNVGAGISRTKYYLSLDDVKDPADRLLTGIRSVTDLTPGASSAGSSVVTVPLTTPPATYLLFACADAAVEVIEMHELNNCVAATSRVNVVLPDLQQIAVDNSTSTAAPGSKFTVNDRLHNSSPVHAAPSSTRYYFSTDSLKNAGDIVLSGKRAIPELEPDETSIGNATVVLPLSVAEGIYYVVGCADDLAKLKESSEANNCATSATTVRVGWPDLVTTNISNPPATAKRGGKLTILDTVRNQGTIPTTASYVRYYLSADDVKNAGDLLLAGSRPVAALEPGASSAGSRQVTVPVSTPLSTYRVLACADDTGKVPESSNANNCVASATTITIR
jgi:hypothetical protein